MKEDGTGLRKDGENDGALAFFKAKAKQLQEVDLKAKKLRDIDANFSTVA